MISLELRFSFSHQFLIQVQFITQYPYDLFPVLYLIVYNGNGTHRPVIRNNHPIGVNNTPSGRLNGTLPLVKVLRHGAVVLGAEQHKKAKPS